MIKLRTIATLIVAVTISGCSTHKYFSRDLLKAMKDENVAEVQKLVENAIKKHSDDRDSLLYYLEGGAAYRYLDDFDKSNELLELAEQRYEDVMKKAKISLSDEAAAALSNQNVLPYKGYGYDYVMMNVYKTLNYLAKNDNEGARVELRRVLEKQREILELNAKRVEKAQKKNEKYDLEKAQKDKKYKESYDCAYQSDAKFKAYAPYVNPFAVLIDALFYRYAAANANDWEHSLKSFQRLMGLAPASRKWIKKDLDALDALLNGKGDKSEPATYLLFETGLAPSRTAIRLHVPVFLPKTVDYAPMELPKLTLTNDYLDHVSVSTAKENCSATTLCDMDVVIKTEFFNLLPSVIGRTMINVGIKMAASYAVNKAADAATKKKSAKTRFGIRLFTALSTIGYQELTAQADLRCWRTLPKKFMYARVATPDDGIVTITTANGSEQIKVKPKSVNVIYVRTLSSNSKVKITTFKIKK